MEANLRTRVVAKLSEEGVTGQPDLCFGTEDDLSTSASLESLKSRISSVKGFLSSQFLRDSKEIEEDLQVVHTLEQSRDCLIQVTELLGWMAKGNLPSPGIRENLQHQFYSEMKDGDEKVLNVSVISDFGDSHSNESQIEIHETDRYMQDAVKEVYQDSNRQNDRPQEGKSFLTYLKESVKNMGNKLKTQGDYRITGNYNTTLGKEGPKKQNKEPLRKPSELVISKMRDQKMSQTCTSAIQANSNRGRSREEQRVPGIIKQSTTLMSSMIERRSVADSYSHLDDDPAAITPKGKAGKNIRDKLREFVQQKLPDTKPPKSPRYQQPREEISHDHSMTHQQNSEAQESRYYGIPSSAQNNHSAVGLKKIVNILPKQSLLRLDGGWNKTQDVHLHSSRTFEGSGPEVGDRAQRQQAVNALEDVRRTSSPEPLGALQYTQPGKGYFIKNDSAEVLNASTQNKEQVKRVPRNSTRVLYPNMMAVQNSYEYTGTNDSQRHSCPRQRMCEGTEPSSNAEMARSQIMLPSRPDGEGIYSKPVDSLPNSSRETNFSARRMNLIQSFLVPSRTYDDPHPDEQPHSRLPPTVSAMSKKDPPVSKHTHREKLHIDPSYSGMFGRQDPKAVSMASAKTLCPKETGVRSVQQTPQTFSPVLSKVKGFTRK